MAQLCVVVTDGQKRILQSSAAGDIFRQHNPRIYLNHKSTITKVRQSSQTKLAPAKRHSILKFTYKQQKCERQRPGQNIRDILYKFIFYRMEFYKNMISTRAQAPSETTLAHSKRRSHMRMCDRYIIFLYTLKSQV